MISLTAEYALRAIVFLADKPGPQTTAQIAAQTEIPAGYLSKVMQGLSRSGLVHAQRGLGGGFVLASKPEALTILDVVNSVDPIRRITTCPLGLHGENLCPLHKKLDDAARDAALAFGSTTVAQLLDVPHDQKPLCGPAQAQR